MIEVTGLAQKPVQHILWHLRALDREEMDAVRGPGWDALTVARQMVLAAATLEGWLFWHHEFGPVAVLGAYSMTPTCAGVWAFGTDDWPLAVTEVTRTIRRSMVPALLEAGFHRAECRALRKRTDSAKWLTALGAKAEAVLSGFGVRREDFILFAWLADEQTHHLKRDAGHDPVPLCAGGGRAGPHQGL